MDEAARYFIEGVRCDPWFVIEEPLSDEKNSQAIS